MRSVVTCRAAVITAVTAERVSMDLWLKRVPWILSLASGRGTLREERRGKEKR